MQRDIAFLIFPEFQLLDLAGPLAAFQMAGTDLEAAPYRLRVLSATGRGDPQQRGRDGAERADG